jgi:hypothetical protein
MIWQSSWQSGGGDRKSLPANNSGKIVTTSLPTSARVTPRGITGSGERKVAIKLARLPQGAGGERRRKSLSIKD